MKKLENEYRQLMQNEVPDLWSRIEAGIDAKIAEDEATKAVVVADETESKDCKADNGIFAEVTTKKEERKVINWKKYSLPFVACIAAILCVPLLLTGFLRMASGGNADTTEMATDCAEADQAAPEETVAVTTDDGTAVVTEESCEEEIDDVYEESFEEMAAEDSVAMTESQFIEDAESMLDAETSSGTTEDYKQNKQEVSELVQILTVTKISQDIRETDSGREKGMAYYLDTEEVGECTLYVPADLAFVPDMEVQFKIQVEVCDEGYDFELVGMVE